MLMRTALGYVLREERMAQKKTLRQISQQGIIALGYLSEIERGQKELSSEILRDVCDTLGLSVAEVLVATADLMAFHEITAYEKAQYSVIKS